MLYTPEYFDELFSGDDDPWKFRSRWYEARKRALTLACLPDARYARAYEPSCANGELSAALAPRCAHLLATDGSERAVALAKKRLAPLANVEVRRAWLPREWPREKFDLIVISEFGFYMNLRQLDDLAEKILESLKPRGTVLACHWRRPVEGSDLDGDRVHQRLDEQLALPLLARVQEPDLRINVWSRDARSVALREGFA